MRDGPVDLPAAASEEGATTETAAIILMVDDDAALRMLFARYLTAFGYTALFARDGDEALRVARGTPKIDIVILDLTMPGLCGQTLANELTALHPEAGLLICSGHPKNALGRLGFEIKRAEFLQKPCRPLELKQRLSDMLASR